MRALWTTAAALLLLLTPGATIALDDTPEMTPMAFEEYLAALDVFAATSSVATEHLGPASTAAEVVAAYEQILALVDADQQRMLNLVPEPCYADAHAEVIAYRATSAELIEQALPAMAESETLPGIVVAIQAMDAELRARHPTAYVESADAGGGFEGSYRHILDALATCASAASPEPRPEQAPAPSPAAESLPEAEPDA